MDKNAIKKYAVWARNELIARVAQKANQYGITEVHLEIPIYMTEKSKSSVIKSKLSVKP